ncbi:hypothetical protein NC653_009225 [Populus alba x Populus x berolinensis]|uniref:Uncharacterized protein n=1 Tax=Populus alba x Populus x berolinensis TaxID=444605 RepID=A0AAD6R9P9_9ROSI|nr:hypothetical protein NC653_009225 [Populus alba x Populus x berolinensis]
MEELGVPSMRSDKLCPLPYYDAIKRCRSNFTCSDTHHILTWPLLPLAPVFDKDNTVLNSTEIKPKLGSTHVENEWTGKNEPTTTISVPDHLQWVLRPKLFFSSSSSSSLIYLQPDFQASKRAVFCQIHQVSSFMKWR